MHNWTIILQSPYYHFNSSSLIPFFLSNLSLFMGVFILFLAPRSIFHRSIFYFYISAAFWFLSYGLRLCAWTEPVLSFWERMIFLGIVFVPVTLLHISFVAIDRYQQRRIFLWFVYLGVVIFIIQLWADLFFDGIQNLQIGFFLQPVGKQAAFFVLLVYIYAFFNVFRHYLNFIKLPQRRETDKLYRNKLKLIIFAFGLAFFANLNILSYYGVGTYPWDFVLLFCSVVVMAYSLVKYHNANFFFRLRDVGQQLKEEKQKADIIRLQLADMGKASIFSSLSAGILHQMCQPVTAIHGLSKFIHNSLPQDSPYLKSMDLIVGQSSYMKDMLNDLMDLVRHKEVKRENINVNACLEKALRLLKDELRIKRIYWDFFPMEQLPFVFADQVHLQQTFMNIIINAIAALSSLSKGERRYLKINTHFDSASNFVLIIFENNGPCFPDIHEERMFEPFITGSEAGVGLGLALCKDLLAEHGGKITAGNIDQFSCRGVRFTVKLPASTF